MAIIPSFPGLTVNVVVNSEPLPEYPLSSASAVTNSKTACYVAAVPETEFTIVYKFASNSFSNTPKNFAIGIEVTIDNKHVDRSSSYWKDIEISLPRTVSGHWTYSKDGEKLRPVVQPMRFTALSIDENRSESVGIQSTIRVSFWRLTTTPSDRDPYARSLLQANPAAVSEKAVKGLAVDLGVGFNTPRPANARNEVDWKYVQGDDERTPFASFEFHYRTQNALKQLGIIERTPSPVPLGDIEPDDMTTQQRQEWKNKQWAKYEVKQEIKRDNLRAPKRSRPVNVEEEEDDDCIFQQLQPVKKKRLAEGVIDLTED